MNIRKRDVELEVRPYAQKGRGLNAVNLIKKDTIIESLPVLVIQPEVYAKVHELPIINHTFVWDKSNPKGETGALGFGFASMCNHSEKPNAWIKKDFDNHSIDLIALRNIQADEEITIRYNKTFFQVF